MKPIETNQRFNHCSDQELAIQVAEELNRIGQFKDKRASLYGGQDIESQISD
jgi:superfamily II DNA/RNA helicase